MTQKQTQAKILLTALENYYPSYFGSDKPISSNFKIQNKVYPKKWVLDETFKLAEIPQDSSDIGVAIRKLEEIYASSATETPTPEYVSNTTLTPDQIVNFDKDIERQRKSEEIRANQKNITEQFKKRNKEIYEEQQKIQEQILKSKAAEPEISKIKDWKIKVEETEKVQFTPEEKTVFNNYKEQIQEASKISDEIKRTEEINQIKIDLAREIHSRAESTLKAQGLENEELDFVVIKTADKIVTELQNSDLPEYFPPIAQLAIHEAVLEKVQAIPTTTASTQTKEVLLSSIGTSARYDLFPNVYLKNVTTAAFGKNVANKVFGSKYEVSISDTPQQGYRYNFNFTQANEYGRSIQNQQNQSLETLKVLGQQEAKTFLLDQSAAYFAKSSLGQKVLTNPKAQVAFYSVFKGAGQTVTWEGVGIGRYAIGTGYENAIYLATGNKYLTPTISAAGGAIGIRIAAKAAAQATTEITFTGGIMAGEAFASGAGQALATQAAVKTGLGGLIAKVATVIGLGTGPVTFGLSAAIGWVVGKVIEKLPQIKKWFSENGWIFGVGAGVGGMMIGGPIAGVVGLGLWLAATGSLAAFAAGAFGVLGFIGRSIGIAIATPVIVTLLVIPPLVAFIMLVINNSAYVVPPSLNESSIGRITSPYIDITKTASPAGPLENSELPAVITYTVTIKAKKSGLSNIKISDSCQVISKTATECPDFEIPSLPESISPTAPFVFTYTGNFSAGYDDSAIINTITVTADSTEQSGATAEVSNSLTIGNPPISCPVPGAKPDNDMNYSYNSGNDTGHGSKRYWTAMGSSYSYAIPQSTSCMKPGDCPYYGYAYDVFPNGTTEVFAPSVLGKDVNWNCSYAFSNGGGKAGYTYHCTSTGSNYLLVLTHLNKNAKEGTIKSGDKIGSLYNQGGNTHLHMEFQLNGQWQKPEDYFCK